jgi:hypothetical protein
MTDFEKFLATELHKHRFLPGKYPDPDYCSCGTRFGLYTRGQARGQWDWHIARELLLKLQVEITMQQPMVSNAKN